jgi:hypothetical protein
MHAPVAAYDRNSKLLAEKTAKINHTHLVRWHLRSRPRASYAVFSYEARQILDDRMDTMTKAIPEPPGAKRRSFVI